MLIRQTRIHTLTHHLSNLSVGSQIVIGLRLVPDFFDMLDAIGFDSKNLVAGDTVLPSIVGPVTRRNADGDYVIHKDRPKEKFVIDREWTWEQWNGPDDTVAQSKTIYQERERYARTLIPANSVELQISYSSEGQVMVTSPPYSYQGTEDQDVLHSINLFLEIFGECEIFDGNLKEVIKAPVRRLNWEILPKGKRGWAELKPELDEIIERASPTRRSVVEERFETINEFEPEFVAIGRAGFAGYVVFGFESKNLFVFESIYLDNATYLFGDDWEHLSRMSKTEILDGNLHTHRIIHTDVWRTRVSAILRSAPNRAR